jgi:hypothetical protein
MKQRAQFKLTGIAGIAGKRYEAQKNRRQLLRGMGVNLAVTPTPEQQSNKPFAAYRFKDFAGLFLGKECRVQIGNWGEQAAHADNLRMDLERPAGVDPAAQYDSLRAQWRLYDVYGVRLMVWDRYGCEMYPQAYGDWGQDPWVSEWKPSCRPARNLHYNTLAGDARKYRTTIERSRAVRVGESFARVIQQFGYARAELYNTHMDYKELHGKSEWNTRMVEHWSSTDKTRGTDPMFVTAEDAYDRELKKHPYYLGHAFTEATGWYLLGSGAYSYAFANDNFPGIVVKLGKNRADACFKYLAWSQRNQHLHGVPSVYFLRDYQMDYMGGGFFVAVLDALTEDRSAARALDLPQCSEAREWEHRIEERWTPERKALYETVELVWQSTEGNPDLHAGNILFTKEGFPVITDPCC